MATLSARGPKFSDLVLRELVQAPMVNTQAAGPVVRLI
jgi:hypothetical protein